jgi:hypothetical protein
MKIKLNLYSKYHSFDLLTEIASLVDIFLLNLEASLKYFTFRIFRVNSEQ